MFDVLVLLSAGPGGVGALRAYEQRVVPILYEYNGELLSAFSPRRDGDDATPDEIHLLRFKSEDDFVAFRRDPRVGFLASERDRAISNTVVYVSDKSVSYDPGDA